jgi:UDP-N-acetylmuramate--alanine ligase
LAAEVAVVLPIYPAREQPIPGVSSQLVVDEARRLGHGNVVAAPRLEDSLRVLDELVLRGDVVLTIGAGDVDRLGGMLLEDTL